jgi:hypothetical protein
VRSRFPTSNATEFYRYRSDLPVDADWVAQGAQQRSAADDPEISFRNLRLKTRQFQEATPESVRLTVTWLGKMSLYTRNTPQTAGVNLFSKHEIKFYCPRWARGKQISQFFAGCRWQIVHGLEQEAAGARLPHSGGG